MSRLLSVSFLSLLVLVYQAQALVLNLDIVNAYIAPDGYNRTTTLAGGQFPGTLITGNKNENFEITVVDELTDTTMTTATSVHWHGLFEANNAWSDGTAMVTQCPIVQGNSFLYNFTATDQAGTFWYHSHYGTQYCDGLRGPLIIYDPEDPHADLYDVDDETTVITLADWYHIVSSQEGNIPIPDSMLINGMGRDSTNPTADLAVINVEQGKRYRFRLIDMGCEANFIFQIDGHPFTIIEADGVNTEPLVVDELQIFAGQRYSIIVEANQTVGNYWIRANPSLGTSGFDNGINSAILRYAGASDVEPTTTQANSTNPLNEVNLTPLENPGAPGNPVPGGADVNINLDMSFNATAFDFTVNGNTFVPPTVPVLLQILSGAQAATDLLPTGLVYTLPTNKTIEISIPGLATGGPHPFHLHGHVFDVVRSANSDTYNYANPVRRDTVSTGLASDNVTIRFETNNAGPWILHCHIDWHLALGLAVVFAEDSGDVASTEAVPPDWSQLCPTWNGKVAPTPQ